MVKDGNKFIIDAPEELTIRTVKVFHESLKEGFDACDGILLNLIGVVEIDTAGFQLLVSLKQEMLKRDKSFGIVGMSMEVDEMISLYGAGSFFDAKG